MTLIFFGMSLILCLTMMVISILRDRPLLMLSRRY